MKVTSNNPQFGAIHLFTKSAMDRVVNGISGITNEERMRESRDLKADLANDTAFLERDTVAEVEHPDNRSMIIAVTDTSTADLTKIGQIDYESADSVRRTLIDPVWELFRQAEKEGRVNVIA